MTGETELPVFNQWNWFWKIGDDDTRYWSSSAGAYVPTADQDKITNVPDEMQLIAVLTHLGLSHP